MSVKDYEKLDLRATDRRTELEGSGSALPRTRPTFNDRRRRAVLQRGSQRREAFRVNVRMPVHVDAPMELFCELRDISYVGVGFDRGLPCSPGIRVRFRLEIPTYGAAAEPEQIELQAEVVHVAWGHTGLRFVDLDREQARAIQELVSTQQRMILAAREAHLQRT